MRATIHTRLWQALAAAAFLGLALCPILFSGQSERDARPFGRNAGSIAGSWYLALDAEPFGLAPGTSLPGLATFHEDGTYTFVDGGDFGGAPFPARDTAQIGSWRQTGREIHGVSLFLQADAATGAVQTWVKVVLTATREDRDMMTGTVDILGLPCNQPAPFPVFGCPDPIAFAGSFAIIPPSQVPIKFTRLPAR